MKGSLNVTEHMNTLGQPMLFLMICLFHGLKLPAPLVIIFLMTRKLCYVVYVEIAENSGKNRK